MQDVLREQLPETVYRSLREQGGHIYVCGDVTMAGDVLKTVQQIIKLQGNMSQEDAGFYLSKLRVGNVHTHARRRSVTHTQPHTQPHTYPHTHSRDRKSVV